MISLNSQKSLSTHPQLCLKTLPWDSTSELLSLSESENSTTLVLPLMKNGTSQPTELGPNCCWDTDYLSNVYSLRGKILSHFIKQNKQNKAKHEAFEAGPLAFSFGWIPSDKCFLLHINLIPKARVTGRSFRYLCPQHQTTEHVIKQTWKQLGSFLGARQMHCCLSVKPSIPVSGGIKLEPQAHSRCHFTNKSYGWMRRGWHLSYLILSSTYRCGILNSAPPHSHPLQKTKCRSVRMYRFNWYLNTVFPHW